MGFDEKIRAENTVDVIPIVELTEFDIEILHAQVSDPEKLDPLCKHVFKGGIVL